ncbi:regulatory protein RecX [Agromyces cerinus]|uniref:Regulatory protein RecX n=1 Tax=Agromyces cerinus subsp. cerinus TaxID=232089 RepID=A0A1N6H6Z4_9MICO|nr:regulatory protein RecX [Agromyces cerinus]SIO15526.1 regulatory protein [Agromyces cerinus subsp. cerinus]
MSDASSERLAPVTYLPWAKAEPTPPTRAAASRSRPAPEPEVEPEAPPVAAARSRPKADGGRGRLRPVSTNETWFGSEQAEPVAEPSEPEETGAERDARIDRLVISRLRRSALSVSEVRAVLVEHGLDDIEVEEWIERYERLGYLDDAKLAEQVVHSHGVRRGRGSGAIMQELGRRGVDNALARAAVEDLDPETELENARAVAERRARQLRGLDRQTAERRLSAFLQRRGYPGDIVREAVTAALAAEGS